MSELAVSRLLGNNGDGANGTYQSATDWATTSAQRQRWEDARPRVPTRRVRGRAARPRPAAWALNERQRRVRGQHAGARYTA